MPQAALTAIESMGHEGREIEGQKSRVGATWSGMMDRLWAALSAPVNVDESMGPYWAWAIGGLIFSMVIVGGFALSHVQERNTRLALLDDLSRLSSNCQVTIDERAVDDCGVFVDFFRSLHPGQRERGVLTQPLRVQITDGSRRVEFTVSRETKRADYYWVFRQRGAASAGRVVDRRLTEFLQQRGF